MRVVILAGGKGTRLRPYTTVFPKPLMPVMGRPILEILVRQLVSNGAEHITIALGYLGNLIRAYFGDGSTFGVKIDYSNEEMPLGTMGPLKLLKELPENFLVMNGDVLTDLNFSEFFKSHCSNSSIFTVGSYERKVYSDFGVLSVNSENSLIGFQEKPSFCFQVSMGVYAINREALEFIPEGKAFGFDQLMHALIKHTKQPKVYLHKGQWLDIGRAEDYDKAQTDYEDLVKSH